MYFIGLALVASILHKPLTRYSTFFWGRNLHFCPFQNPFDRPGRRRWHPATSRRGIGDCKVQCRRPTRICWKKMLFFTWQDILHCYSTQENSFFNLEKDSAFLDLRSREGPKNAHSSVDFRSSIIFEAQKYNNTTSPPPLKGRKINLTVIKF